MPESFKGIPVNPNPVTPFSPCLTPTPTDSPSLKTDNPNRIIQNRVSQNQTVQNQTIQNQTRGNKT